MADLFVITPPVVRAEGKDVPPEQIQAGFNSLARQTQIGLNSVASDPTGPASGDLGGMYPAPTVVAVHAIGGTLDGVAIGSTTPSTGAFTTLTASTPVAVTSGGTGQNALNAHNVIIGEGSSAVGFAAPGTAGQLLASNGAAADPSFQTQASLGIAPLANPAFSGTPTAPTAAAHTNTTQLATTAFVETEFASPPTAGVGSVTPSPGAFTTLAASSGLNSTAVGNTTPSTGAFTTLSASSTVSGTGFVNRFASPGPIGNTASSTGAFTTLSSTGTFTPSSTNGIVGTTTNDNANAGSVGEVISSTIASGSAVGLTNAAPANVTSISLTAGDWDVHGNVAFNIGATTTTSFVSGAISTTSATIDFSKSFLTPAPATGNTIAAGACPTQRISLASTTTVFLVTQCNFGTSTLSAYGTIYARRRR